MKQSKTRPTSSIDEAHIRKPPDVAQSNRIAETGQYEFDRVAPLASVVITLNLHSFLTRGRHLL